MSIRFVQSARLPGTIEVRMLVEVPVAEIAMSGGRRELHFHAIADQLTAEDRQKMRDVARAEVDRLNIVYNVTKRLLG